MKRSERPQPVRAALEQGVWFSGLPEALKQRIVDSCEERSYRAGEVIVQEGETARGLHALLRGRVCALRSVGERQQVLMYLTAPGFWFGEYAVLARQPTIGSFVADGPARVLFLPLSAFEEIVAGSAEWLRCFTALLCERFAVLYVGYAVAQGAASEDWLHARLAGIVELERRTAAGRDPALIPLSQTELADMLGVSRQTLNALLARLADRGVVEVGYRRVRLLR